MELKCGWEFPGTGWGTENGKNDPGIETFRGDPFPAVTREPIQNSIDAHDSEEPLKVEFSTFEIDANDFPKKDEYLSILEMCLAEKDQDTDTYKELLKARELLLTDKIYFLKISDYNTSGLQGSEELRKTDWHRLIKVVGESEKNDTSGGSFGIGKYASFVCSDLKAVFYSTLDKNNEFAFQGVAKLISFYDEEKGPRQATGFFGVREKIQPIKDPNLISLFNKYPFLNRKTIGTDIFIAGFKFFENWDTEIQEAVVNNFFFAIHNKDLEVVVNGKLINYETLPQLVIEMRNRGSKSNAIKYYEVLTDSTTQCIVEEDFNGMGEVRLYINTKSHYHKKTALIRKTGMLIKEKQNYQIPLKYAAVLVIKGERFNSELRSIENPTHTDWEPKRHREPKRMNKILTELNHWLNEKIYSIAPYKDEKTIELEELAAFLPDENTEIDTNSLEKGEGEEVSSNIQVTLKKKLVKVSNEFEAAEIENLTSSIGEATEEISGDFMEDEVEDTPEDEVEDTPEDEVEDTPEDEVEDTPEDEVEDTPEDEVEDTPEDEVEDTPEDEVEDTPEDEVEDTPEDEVEDTPEDEVEDTSNEPVRPRKNRKNKKSIKVLNQKVFCINPDEANYRLIIETNADGILNVEVDIIGTDKNYPASIQNAVNNGLKTDVNYNRIGPLQLKSGKNIIDFQLIEKVRVALGVKYVDN